MSLHSSCLFRSTLALFEDTIALPLLPVLLLEHWLVQELLWFLWQIIPASFDLQLFSLLHDFDRSFVLKHKINNIFETNTLTRANRVYIHV